MQVLASTGNLNPSLALVGVNQHPLIENGENPFSANPDDAFIAYTLPETAAYGLLISTTGSGTEGEFLLQLALDSPAVIIPLAASRYTI